MLTIIDSCHDSRYVGTAVLILSVVNVIIATVAVFVSA